MRLVTFAVDGRSAVGVLMAGEVWDVSQPLAAAGRAVPRDAGDLIASPADLRLLADATWDPAAAIPASSVEFLPPVLRPTKVIGVGMNYRSFVRQLGVQVPQHLSLFHKTSSALIGHGSLVRLPAVTDQAVPEGELALMIGRRANRISSEQAPAHVAGYTCANDISARDLEFRTSQWTAGKMLPTFCPLGPSLVTVDEVAFPESLSLRTMLNGDLIQEGNTSDMVFGLDRLVSELSLLVTLEVGDIILTGTPSDLGATATPVFLRAGDTVTVQIEGIGTLENRVVREASQAR